MMDAPIISRTLIRAKARDAFNRGVKRNGHNFNWHSTAAINVWQAEWDHCAAMAAHAGAVVKFAMGKGTPP